MSQLDLRNLARNPGGAVLGLEVVVVRDPAQVVEHLVRLGEQIESGGRRACGWFDAYLARGGRSGPIQVSPIGETPTYLGRVCCYQHLTDMERRLSNLPIPHETTCQGCQRVFRIQWAVKTRR